MIAVRSRSHIFRLEFPTRTAFLDSTDDCDDVRPPFRPGIRQTWHVAPTLWGIVAPVYSQPAISNPNMPRCCQAQTRKSALLRRFHTRSIYPLEGALSMYCIVRKCSKKLGTSNFLSSCLTDIVGGIRKHDIRFPCHIPEILRCSGEFYSKFHEVTPKWLDWCQSQTRGDAG